MEKVLFYASYIFLLVECITLRQPKFWAGEKIYRLRTRVIDTWYWIWIIAVAATFSVWWGVLFAAWTFVPRQVGSYFTKLSLKKYCELGSCYKMGPDWIMRLDAVGSLCFLAYYIKVTGNMPWF